MSNTSLCTAVALALTASSIFGQTETGVAPAPSAPAPSELPAMAIARVAAREGVDVRRLTLAHAATPIYPLQGVRGRAFKIMDAISGAVYSVLLDEDGREFDGEARLARERTLRDRRWGSLDERLAAALDGARPSQRVAVRVWLRSTYVPPRRPAARSPATRDPAIEAPGLECSIRS